MPPWQAEEAENRFGEVLERAATEGPQVITKGGIETGVVLSMEDYQRLLAARMDFKAFLCGAPFEDGSPLDRDDP